MVILEGLGRINDQKEVQEVSGCSWYVYFLVWWPIMLGTCVCFAKIQRVIYMNIHNTYTDSCTLLYVCYPSVKTENNTWSTDSHAWCFVDMQHMPVLCLPEPSLEEENGEENLPKWQITEELGLTILSGGEMRGLRRNCTEDGVAGRMPTRKWWGIRDQLQTSKEVGKQAPWACEKFVLG